MGHPLTFQILCATEHDQICNLDTDQSDDASDRQTRPRTLRECLIVLSGRTQDGDCVVLLLEGYKPSIKVVRSQAGACRILNEAASKSGGEASCDIDTATLFEFKGYHPKPTKFLKYAFPSNMQFLSARKRLKQEGFSAYDAALPASLQMLSDLQISPCSWISVHPRSQHKSNGGICAIAQWSAISICDDPPASVAPFRVMAFDIECHSSHGEFPRARKGYERMARELAAVGNEKLGDVAWVHDQLRASLCSSKPANSAAGDMDQSDRVLSLVYTKTHPTDAALQDVANAVADQFRPRAAGEAPTKMMELGARLHTPSAIKKRDRRILDILSASQLPCVQGDPVIQIGTSMRCLGRGDASDVNTIFVLGTCSEVEGSTVVSYTSERDMLRDFFAHVRDASPDFFTGYNIFGFDCSYMTQRAIEVGLDMESLPHRCDPHVYGSDMTSKLLRSGWHLDCAKNMVVSRGSADREDTYFEFQGRISFDLMSVVQKGHSLSSYRLDAVARHFTGEHKDDVTPEQIFKSHTGTAADRAEVARYCVQDCRLVLHLIDKLNTIPNALGMADVCGVPVGWIFLRGQGCKILSLVSRQCRRDGFAVPAMGRESVSVNYEGATVLDPCVGAYIDQPVVVLDFSSLYPSSMISHNISHDTFMGKAFGGGTIEDDTVQTGEQLEFDITVRNYDRDSGKSFGEPIQDGKTCARFVTKEVREGVVPRILKRLLAERKRVRGLIKTEHDEFARSTLDGLQLAYKVTANSLYGQLGAPTSPVFMPELAAATTAVGRSMLLRLRDFAESEAGARVIYGDTDSCFMVFEGACAQCGDPHARIRASIEAGKACSESFRKRIPAPHDAEYEKTFSPFVLMSKKRYAGNLYENADDTPKRASMGIVLRRRDNADIVKRVYGRVIDLVMERDVKAATHYARDEMIKLVKGEVDVSELTISKTLRAPSAYVDPDKIAHVVLARRMNTREPGSAPNIGERMPYVHVMASKGTLQGDRIEHPGYLKGSRIDYAHYLTNQLMKPLTQLFSVLIESMPGAAETRKSSPKKIEADVHRIVFAKAMNALPTAQGGLQDISTFFTKRGSLDT